MRRGAQLKECAAMKSILVSLVAAGTCFVIFSPSVASAASNPAGTGRPGQTCQNQLFPGQPITTNVLTTPGQHSGTVVQGAASSPGSVFNEPTPFGTNSTNGGTGGQAYNAAGAPSQYDVACYQQTQRLQMP
jgi:hypothetical protein